MLSTAACSTEAAQAARGRTIFVCAGDRSLTVDRSRKTAVVTYGNARYELPRRPSSLGDRYASLDATLIIDGDMAAFATSTVTDLNLCRAVQGPMAS